MRHRTPKALALNELAERIADAAELSVWQTKDVLRVLALVIPDALAEGHSVEIAGLGVFSRTTRKGRYIMDLKMGGMRWLNETATVRFTAAKAAKAKMKFNPKQEKER